MTTFLPSPTITLTAAKVAAFDTRYQTARQHEPTPFIWLKIDGPQTIKKLIGRQLAKHPPKGVEK